VTTKSVRDVARLATLAAVVLALVGLIVQGPAPASTAPRQAPQTTTAEPSPAEPPPLPGAPDAATVAQQVEDQVRARMRRVSDGSRVAVSVRDKASESTFDFGSGRFATASLVKVHLVAVMLWRAEQAGVGLTAAQRSDAEQMLIRSENDPANRAYAAMGGAAGIERGLKQALGSSRIQVGEQFRWGHSMTRPRAVVALLGEVLDTEHDTPYELMQDAMSRVVPEQRWGVSALADRGTKVQTKVGWVQDPDGWVVNSSGRVLVDDEPVLISVMTDRNATLDDGIATVEKVARLVGDVVRTRRAAQQKELPFSSAPRRSAVHVG
jgi:hypothetical protein